MPEKSNYWKRQSRRMFLRQAGVVAIGTGAVAMVGCGDDDDDDIPDGQTPTADGTTTQTTDAGTPVRGGTLRTGVSTAVLGIDPHVETSVGLQTGARIYSALIRYNPDTNEVRGQLASGPPEQPTPTEYIFQLHPDAKYQDISPVDGRAVTADDVLYSFERFRDLPNATRNGYFKTIVDTMEALDETTFRLTTKQPYVETFSELGLGGGQGPVAQVVAREDVEKRGDLSNGGVGSGPFILDAYSKGEFTRLVRNPNYWEEGLPYLDGWDEQVITDPQVLLQAFQTDRIDINGATLTKLDFDDMSTNDDWVATSVPSLSNGALELDVSRPPFDNPQVRQAVRRGVNRQQIVDKLFFGDAVPAGAITRGLSYWVLPDDEVAPFNEYNPQEAKALLSAAGYADGFDLEIISSTHPIYQGYAEILVSELNRMGINATQSLYDIGVFVSQYMYAGNFPSAVWVMNGYPSLVTPLNYYHSNGLGSGNWWHYSNTEVDTLIENQFKDFDAESRRDTVHQVQRLVLSDWTPHGLMVDSNTYSVHHKRVGGFNPALRSAQYTQYTEYLVDA